MEALLTVGIATFIVFAYIADWEWIISKAFYLIGGCGEN